MHDLEPEPTAAPPARERLPRRVKALYGLGDHTINLSLSSLAFFFGYFLTEVAGVRPALAGLIPLIGRAVDAVSDPLMGRLSDATPWKAGRRRPFFLIGMIPFGAAFAALWWNVPAEDPLARFLYYAGAYVVFSLSSTVIAVPYLSLVPELTASYHERTSINAWRATFAILGTLLAVTTLRTLAEGPVASALGGRAQGYAGTGLLFGLWMMWPWLVVHRVTWERPELHRPAKEGFLQGVISLARHPAYRSLVGLFILGRIAIDLSTAMFIFYFSFWLGRPDDFEITMGLFLVCVVAAFPVWTRVAAHRDKRTIFLFGAAWWVGSQVFLMLAQPEWPRVAIFFGAALAGVGYAAADMIPWSMLGEVVDEDELRSGERREGIYFGFFTFLRKLGGAVGVALAFLVLDLVGFERGGGEQDATVLLAIRSLTAGAPAVFVLLAAWVALTYPIGRARHDEILRALEARRRGEGA
ncbi:MAG: glycoside-pentoside-hexuronide (GPH):cation symporter [Myxococcota bacterium]|nr:glycoside-pentoside-hexuronide (GPH):cation symporter [Myxococcota bacterium]